MALASSFVMSIFVSLNSLLALPYNAFLISALVRLSISLTSSSLNFSFSFFFKSEIFMLISGSLEYSFGYCAFINTFSFCSFSFLISNSFTISKKPSLFKRRSSINFVLLDASIKISFLPSTINSAPIIILLSSAFLLKSVISIFIVPPSRKISKASNMVDFPTSFCPMITFILLSKSIFSSLYDLKFFNVKLFNFILNSLYF